MTESACARRVEGVISRTIAGETVLVPIHSRAEELGLFTLNSVASFIWERMDGRPLRDIASELAATYDVSIEEATTDLTHFARELVAARCAEVC